MPHGDRPAGGIGGTDPAAENAPAVWSVCFQVDDVDAAVQRVRDAGGAVTVCGYVNPGAGDTPFVGTLVEGGFIVTDLGGPAERTIAVQQACHGRGIYI